MMDEKVIGRIKTLLNQGKSKEQVYTALLSEGQTVESIQANFHFVTSDQDKEDTHKKTVHIILTIAAILVGAGVFSFVASNWAYMGKFVKVMIIVSSMLVSYITGWYFKEKRQLIKTGEAFFILGSLIYGAGIFLVAQMFHIRANWPDGFILWMFGVIALGYALELFPLFYLAILLGVISIIGHPFWMFASSYPNSFLFTSSLLLILASIVTFIMGIMIRRKIPEELKDLH